MRHGWISRRSATQSSLLPCTPTAALLLRLGLLPVSSLIGVFPKVAPIAFPISVAAGFSSTPVPCLMALTPFFGRQRRRRVRPIHGLVVEPLAYDLIIDYLSLLKRLGKLGLGA